MHARLMVFTMYKSLFMLNVVCLYETLRELLHVRRKKKKEMKNVLNLEYLMKSSTKDYDEIVV